MYSIKKNARRKHTNIQSLYRKYYLGIKYTNIYIIIYFIERIKTLPKQI